MKPEFFVKVLFLQTQSILFGNNLEMNVMTSKMHGNKVFVDDIFFRVIDLLSI